ncbi:MAG: HAMP domain-containing histidine kinase [bacterium]|nr:HAMP domain-containing histidine kinase [bacterium]
MTPDPTPATGARALFVRAFRGDPVLQAATLVVLAAVALFALPLAAGFELIDFYEGNLIGLVAAVWALRHGLGKIERPAEHRFWELCSYAFSCWLAAMLFWVFFPKANLTLWGQLLEDSLYVLYYLFLLSAVETHPHRVFSPEHLHAWRARRRFELEGAAFFFIGLTVYYIVIPTAVSAEEYITFVPSGSLYLAIDLLLLVRIAYVHRITRDPRWRTLYGALALTISCTTVTDAIDLLGYYPSSWFVYSWKEVPPLYFTPWYVYLFPLVVFARLRHALPRGEVAEASEEALIRERLAYPFSNILLLYAALLPVLHLVYQFYRLPDAAADRPRSLVVLFYLVAFGQLLHRQHKYEQTRGMLLEVERQKSEERERLVSELEARSAETERFAYTVSHDLRSPLTGITGYLGLLEDGVAAGERSRTEIPIRRIRQAAKSMNRLLEDVMEVARSGQIVGEPREVRLLGLAREAQVLVAGPLHERGVEVDISPDLPMVFGDRTRLLQVLQNLLENAAKYMGDQAAPRVEIGMREDPEGPVCYVRDNGIGIEPEHQEEVFTLFRQLDAGGDGSGIGLATVRRIIEVHGGRVWVESEGRGQGCSICFTVPGVS